MTGLMSMALISCSDDDEEKGVSVIFNGNQITATVFGSIDLDVDYVAFDLEDWSDNIFNVGKSEYKNGGFSITLLTDVPDRYLVDIREGDLFSDAEISSISNDTARIIDYLWIDGYKGNEVVGEFFRTNMTLSEMNNESYKVGQALANFTYVTRDVKIKAKKTYSEDGMSVTQIYDLTLKKGWNEIVMKITEANDNKLKFQITSNIEPSGMKWIFRPDNYDYESSAKSLKMVKKSIWHKLRH